jgi:hypothetical protein
VRAEVAGWPGVSRTAVDAVDSADHDSAGVSAGVTDGRREGNEHAMTDEPAEEAAEKVADDDRLLEGENPETPYLEDATHWVTVYNELLGVKRDLVGASESRLPELSAEARHEVASTDLVVLDEEMKRFSRRLAYWRERCVELGGSSRD